MKNPVITFVIPILNNEDMLGDCLKSIKMQDYPKEKIEIITPDGGSRDKSTTIAKAYGCRIIQNKKVLAEPGFMVGSEHARGELIVYMGSDNRLSDKKWIKNMVKPFENPEIIGAYPWHKNNPANTWLTKYFNTFTDPVNHFILGFSCNPLYFYRNYQVFKETKNYVIYDFNLHNFPMIAFDQGFTIRKAYNRPRETEYDDILPVLNLIKKNMKLAFVQKASNYHYTLEKGLAQYAKKMRWIIDNNITPNAKFGLPTRTKHFSVSRRLKYYIWPIYVISIIGPAIHCLIGLMRDRKKEWLYHAPITTITAGLILYEIVRLKIFRQKSLVSRQ